MPIAQTMRPLNFKKYKINLKFPPHSISLSTQKYFVAFCDNAKEVDFLSFCLLLLFKFFYIFEDRHINRGRIYASQPRQEGAQKTIPRLWVHHILLSS